MSDPTLETSIHFSDGDDCDTNRQRVHEVGLALGAVTLEDYTFGHLDKDRLAKWIALGEGDTVWLRGKDGIGGIQFSSMPDLLNALAFADIMIHDAVVTAMEQGHEANARAFATAMAEALNQNVRLVKIDENGETELIDIAVTDQNQVRN